MLDVRQPIAFGERTCPFSITAMARPGIFCRAISDFAYSSNGAARSSAQTKLALRLNAPANKTRMVRSGRKRGVGRVGLSTPNIGINMQKICSQNLLNVAGWPTRACQIIGEHPESHYASGIYRQVKNRDDSLRIGGLMLRFPKSLISIRTIFRFMETDLLTAP